MCCSLNDLKMFDKRFFARYAEGSITTREYSQMNVEDIFDADGTALQAALDLIEVILETDPGVYDETAAPVVLLLRQRLSSSWRNEPARAK
jgi:hypothetical protein